MDLPALSRPENLLWLLLLPVLFWLSRPQPPRQVALTPHLALWLRARARLGRRAIRFRWRRFLLLALAFGTTVLALCGPTHGGREGPRALAIVLDASTSMGAGAPDSPWSRARALIEERLHDLPAHVVAQIALCGAEVRVLTGSTEELIAQLDVAPAGAGAVDLDDLVASLASSASRVAVWTITDGLGPTAPPRAGALTVLGAPAANAGFTAVHVADAWPLPELAIDAELHNFADAPREVRIAAEGGVAAAPPIAVTIPAGGTERVTLALRRTTGGRLRVSFEGAADALAADDAVEIDLAPPPPADIAVLADSDAGPWIQRAAQALARTTGGQVVPGGGKGRVGFLMVEGGILPDLGAGARSLTFGTRQSTHELTEADMVLQPRVVDWDRTDPLTRDLDLSELWVAASLRADFLGAEDGKPLLFGEHGPLLVAEETPAGYSVHASFRLSDSNLALLPAFPQLVRRTFARAFGAAAGPRLSPANLLDARESRLQRLAPPAAYVDRPLPEFGAPGTSLAVPLLVLALAAVALRVYA